MPRFDHLAHRRPGNGGAQWQRWHGLAAKRRLVDENAQHRVNRHENIADKECALAHFGQRHLIHGKIRSLQMGVGIVPQNHFFRCRVTKRHLLHPICFLQDSALCQLRAVPADFHHVRSCVHHSTVLRPRPDHACTSRFAKPAFLSNFPPMPGMASRAPVAQNMRARLRSLEVCYIQMILKPRAIILDLRPGLMPMPSIRNCAIAVCASANKN